VSSTDVLLNVATAARLFHASDGTGFADLIIDGHRETWPLRGKRFQAWLRQQYYERTWDAPSPAALNAALNVLEAQAQFDALQRWNLKLQQPQRSIAPATEHITESAWTM
jgi:hypothetical protein